jgi:hypothetical protein
MSRNASSRWTMIVVAVLAFVTVFALAGASGGTAAAKPAKKCKKAKRAAVAKKCKKGKAKPAAPAPVPTVTLPPPGPMARMTISWSQTVDVDLYAYDAQNRAAAADSKGGMVDDAIPDTSHSPNATAGGSETFTDNTFVAGGSNRAFGYLICFFGDASVNVSEVGPDGSATKFSVIGGNDTAVVIGTIPDVGCPA